MLSLTARIWEGHDYLPQVWDDWLLDSAGRLVAARLDGRLVGIGKLTRLALGQWWFEGLRVHPDYEGRGIASHMHEYLLASWQDVGSGVLRLATSAKRLPIHHLCYRTGFGKVAEVTSYRAPVLDDPVHGFTQLPEANWDQVQPMLANSPTVSLAGRLWDLGWEWAAPRQAFLEQAVGRGLAFGWRSGRGLLVLRIDEDEDDPLSPLPWVQILACGLDDLPDLLLDYRRLALALGYSQACWMAGLNPEIQFRLEAAGFERTWDSSLYIFEKR